MKKIFITCSLVLVGITLAFGQAKKPTLMVVPSDAWCNTNGYMMEFDNQGTKVKIPDYKRAMQENTDLLLVIASINDMMAERGFPLKNMESAIKTLEDGLTLSSHPQDKSQSYFTFPNASECVEFENEGLTIVDEQAYMAFMRRYYIDN